MLLPSETFAQEKDTGGHEFDSLYDARYDNRIVRVRAIFALTGFRENRRRYAKKQQKNTTGDFYQSERGVRLALSTTSVRNPEVNTTAGRDIFVSSLVSARDADIRCRDRERVPCRACGHNLSLDLGLPHFYFEASHIRRTCEYTKKILAISCKQCALLRMREIRNDVKPETT